MEQTTNIYIDYQCPKGRATMGQELVKNAIQDNEIHAIKDNKD